MRFFSIFLYFSAFPLFFTIFSNNILLLQLFNYYILIFFPCPTYLN
uniref:Uncharacterized protein n=1 Tax=Hormiphora californensis TaxID=1403702 RepID=A0A6C0SQP6_HORCA|nr:hypothetical protein G6P39_mgp02 [Hormiphora californensis]QIA92680.1 hypothetical protein [Hormiphora californensis]QIA92694.1 hypothetical protein [Hormiphora californensis]